MMNVAERVASNGVRVVAESLPFTKSASFCIWVGSGSSYERRGESGLSHFLEHMTFKGTRSRPSSLAVAEAVEGLGGSMNAFTRKESTCYVVKVPFDRAEAGFSVLVDMVEGSLFDPDQIASERGVILEEIRMGKDQPAFWCQVLLERVLFGDTPLGRPIAGCEDVVADVERDGLLAFRCEHYRSGSVVVSAAGHIDEDTVVGMAGGLGEMHHGEPSRPDEDLVKADQNRPVLVETRDGSQVNVAIGFLGPGRHDERRFALALLGSALGRGMSSRLFQEIRVRQSLAYAVSSQYLSYVPVGYLSITAGVDSSRVEQFFRAIASVLAEVRSRGFGDEEIQRAKDFVTGNTTLRMEDTMSRALWLGETVIMDDPDRSVDQTISEIQRVDPALIHESAGDLFTGDNCRVAVVGGLSQEGEDLAESFLSQL